MVLRCLLVVSCAVMFVGCAADVEPDDGSPRGETSAVVFGVTQRPDGTTLAGHEYRFLGWEDVSFGPWAAQSQDVPLGSCARTSSQDEPRRPHVGDGGRARFMGGGSPADGLIIDANGPAASHAGAVFIGERPLTFTIDSGFGVPRLDPIELPSPNVALRVTSPADEAGVLHVDGARDLRIAWTGEGEGEGSVMVVLRPADASPRIRCFFRERDGAGVVPARFITALGTGELTVASHRQVNAFPGAGWLVQVVATAVVRERSFLVESP